MAASVCKTRDEIIPYIMTREQFEAAREVYPGKMPYKRDWEVTKVIDRGCFEVYRYEVTGINHCCPPGDNNREFIWCVPRISWRYFMP